MSSEQYRWRCFFEVHRKECARHFKTLSMTLRHCYSKSISCTQCCQMWRFIATVAILRVKWRSVFFEWRFFLNKESPLFWVKLSLLANFVFIMDIFFKKNSPKSHTPQSICPKCGDFFQKCGDFEEFLSGDFVAIFDYRSGDFEPK